MNERGGIRVERAGGRCGSIERIRSVGPIVAVALVLGCGSRPDPIQSADLVPVPIDAGSVSSPDRSYRIRLDAPALHLDAEALGYDESEIALFFPGMDVALITFAHRGSPLSIDDLVFNRRRMVLEAGDMTFISETRFFLSSGRYRAASLSLFEGTSRVVERYAYSLVCDLATGKLEVLAWTTNEDMLEELRETILGLRLEEE